MLCLSKDIGWARGLGEVEASRKFAETLTMYGTLPCWMGYISR